VPRCSLGKFEGLWVLRHKLSMSFKGAHFLSAVLVVSKDAKALADFYKNILGVPLEEEKHGSTDLHYGCELGDLHFAIHPLENFGGQEVRPGSIKLAFEVFDIEAFVEEMKNKKVPLLYAPKDVGFMKITAVSDPDGNTVEITQLGPRWYAHLEKRRASGQCLIERFKTQKAADTPSAAAPLER
jgi:catechol 2,3-dioxygenase-like lactoylglutathione lyase family enzyme